MNQNIIDLTPTFLKGKELLSSGYTMDNLLNSIQEFGLSNNLTCDWDKGDEIWGTIFYKGKSGYEIMFHADLPMVFVSAEIHEKIILFLQKGKIALPVLFKVADWDGKNYRLNVKLLENVIDWHSDLSPDCISLRDLWYATI